ncbi:MAG: short-chain dehydrogenase, partial [Mycobacteriales bacterium]
PVARVVGPVVLQSAAAGALPTVRAATDPGVSGGGFVGPRRFHQARGAPELLEVYPPGRDGAAATRLWALSEKLTGASFGV